MGSITYRRRKDLGDLMQSRYAMGITLWISMYFRPISQNAASCIISSSGLSWSDCHASTYTAHPPAPALLRPLFTFRKQLQVLRQRTGFFAICPPQPFHLVQLCGLCGVLSHPVCLCTLVPLSQSQEQWVHRTQKEGGRRDRPFPPAPLEGARALCLPTTLSRCPSPFMSPLYLPPSCECRKAPRSACSVPGHLHLLCLLPRCFPTVRAPVSPHLRQQPLLVFL